MCLPVLQDVVAANGNIHKLGAVIIESSRSELETVISSNLTSAHKCEFLHFTNKK
jgi:hypothetical protein